MQTCSRDDRSALPASQLPGKSDQAWIGLLVHLAGSSNAGRDSTAQVEGLGGILQAENGYLFSPFSSPSFPANEHRVLSRHLVFSRPAHSPMWPEANSERGTSPRPNILPSSLLPPKYSDYGYLPPQWLWSCSSLSDPLVNQGRSLQRHP